MTESICKNCSRCCRGWTVPLVESDIENIKSSLGKEDIKNFIWKSSLLDIEIENYNDENLWCRGLKGKIVYQLKKNENNDCIFWDEGNRCRIYVDRPICCRIFPYWEKDGELIFDVSASHVNCEIQLAGIELKDDESLEMLRKINKFRKDLDHIMKSLSLLDSAKSNSA